MAERHRADRPVPVLPRAVTGVRVDHALRPEHGGDRVAFRADFEPVPGRKGKGFTVRVEPSEAGGEVPAPLRSALTKAVKRAWEDGVRGAPEYRALVTLYDVEWRLDGDPAGAPVLEEAAELVAAEVLRVLLEHASPVPVGRRALPRPPLPPRALRGVYVRYVFQGACGPFAITWADVEPLPGGADAEDLVLVDDLPEEGGPDGPLPEEYRDAFFEGVRQVLERKGRGRPPYALKVVLRDAVQHLVDSSEHGFRMAGVYTVLEALACFEEGRDPRPAGRGSPAASGGLRGIPPMPRTRRGA
ncbi:hypothetical protein [Nocardiopsis potens]|uniref:hypothetical protein n=1 Tax=Nocardiopsis potens TaxID=1246458 RepID=UPI00035ED6AF|nr:hypothetical protein [Nocardiopsis potens]